MRVRRTSPQYNGFGALQIVPPLFVGPARSLLQSQGLPTQVLTDAGEIDAEGVLSIAFDTIELRTRLAAPVRFPIQGGPSDPETAVLLKEIQPAITFSGRAGRYTVAPYGNPTTISGAIRRAGPLVGLGLGAALLGTLLLGGAIFGRGASKKLAQYGRQYRR